jgi:hypothetical protein
MTIVVMAERNAVAVTPCHSMRFFLMKAVINAIAVILGQAGVFR